MGANYDFSGYVTKNDLRCSDGRTIRKNAFKDCNGKKVPLVWQHMHDDPSNVIGHMILENKEDGVVGYAYLNDTPKGKTVKAIVDHGDVSALSIYANQLKQKGGDVLHGVIREVSVVLAGANPGASILFPTLAHGEESETEAVIYADEPIFLFHADQDEEEDDVAEKDEEDKKPEPDEDDKEKDPKKEEDDESEESEEKKDEEDEMAHEDRTVQDVFDELTEEQQNVVYYMIGQALEDAGVSDEDTEETEEMKHNVFENDARGDYLSHEDMETIFADAKRLGSLRDSVIQHMEEGVLAHSTPTTGMTGPSVSTALQTYGFRDPDMLFPEARALNNPPDWIKRETGWVQKLMTGVHHTPFSRIKSVFADITEDEARAKGYIKGNKKKEEVFTLLKRTTTPTTIYKKQKLDRDDVIDITDFDVVAWIRAEMRVMLDEEIARAILIGDGRSGASDDKINETNVRPIASDSDLFAVPVNVTGGTPKEFINASIRGRKYYKGTGSPTLFTTADMHTEMLLLEDTLGHKLYKSDAELATALRVSEIVEVEVMEGAKVNGKDLLGIIVNPVDYNVGADKGGEINMFDDFDIDYNQMKYLIETRISGALTKPFSALVLTKGTGAQGATGATGATGSTGTTGA